jgi:hypothetical protein
MLSCSVCSPDGSRSPLLVPALPMPAAQATLGAQGPGAEVRPATAFPDESVRGIQAAPRALGNSNFTTRRGTRKGPSEEAFRGHFFGDQRFYHHVIEKTATFGPVFGFRQSVLIINIKIGPRSFCGTRKIGPSAHGATSFKSVPAAFEIAFGNAGSRNRRRPQ